MKVKTMWRMVFEAVYCDVSGDHYATRIAVDAEADTSDAAILKCWTKVVERANTIMPVKAALVSIELMDGDPYVTIEKGGN